MLSLLCSSPRPDDYDLGPHSPARSTRPGRRLSLPAAARKKRIQKLSISSPTDFVHTGHLGSEQVATGALWDQRQWAAPPPPPRLQTIGRPQSQPVLNSGLPIVPVARRASLPLGQQYPSPLPMPLPKHDDDVGAGPISPVKRKPIPAYLDETASVSPFPSAIISRTRRASQELASAPTTTNYSQSQSQSQYSQPTPEMQYSPRQERPLVRLLDTLPEGRDPENPLLVTQTTKARFDGAMREIAQALRDPHT
ncbi:hypothetical protein BKA62DRAFT_92017 [Auriculariales sp. MPI-PUGE-AT-0066]|nr:hypothetical protein BKA62DRAFT_92017 [Auriculariales sp. MPI-PUGE-AT-0066]